MIEFAGLVGAVLVAFAIAALSEGWMRTGFCLQIASTLCWGAVAIGSGLWSLLALQIWIAVWAARGLLRLERETS